MESLSGLIFLMQSFAIWWIVFINDEIILGGGGVYLKKIKILNYFQILYSSWIGEQHKLVYFYLLFIGRYG